MKSKLPDEKQYVFVYGTLREGGTNHNRLKVEPNLTKIGLGVTKDKYSFIGAISGSFPYASRHTFDNVKKVNIIGELYEVLSQSYLDELDKFEYNYSRETVSVVVNNKIYNANMYMLTNSELIDGVNKNIYPNGRNRFYAIESGDWFENK